MRVINSLVVLILVAGLAFITLGYLTPQFEYSTEIDVAAPVAESYAAYRDPERLGIWLEGFVNIEYLRGDPGEVGAFYRLTFEENGESFFFTEELTELTDNEFISISLDGEMMSIDISTAFAANGSGSTIRTTNTVRPKGLFYRAFLRIMRGDMEARQRSDYERLKRLIESG